MRNFLTCIFNQIVTKISYSKCLLNKNFKLFTRAFMEVAERQLCRKIIQHIISYMILKTFMDQIAFCFWIDQIAF